MKYLSVLMLEVSLSKHESKVEKNVKLLKRDYFLVVSLKFLGFG